MPPETTTESVIVAPGLATTAQKTVREGFWRRRVIAPFKAQLTQGISPDKLAMTCAVGFSVSMFPILGTTSILNLIIGMRLRMNQPILQLLNQLLGPIHIAMIIAYIEVGAWIWGHQAAAFSLESAKEIISQMSLSLFLEHFGWACVHSITAWILSLPLMIPALYFTMRPVMRHAAKMLAANPQTKKE